MVCVTGIDVPGLGGEREVTLIMGRDADQAGALLPGLPQHLPGADAEPFGNIVFGQHNAVAALRVAADSHREGPELGQGQQLHGGVEAV